MERQDRSNNQQGATGSPWAALLSSRKFLLLLMNTGLAMLSMLSGRFLSAESAELIQDMVVTVTPVFIAVIVGITIEDAAEKRAGTSREQDSSLPY